ncbi:MAG: TPM domain-containing protein [Bifidobacteriaceae bacterium]|nr:TPM domain-containing protein [Bifidobacteriaceae bacterium]
MTFSFIQDPKLVLANDLVATIDEVKTKYEPMQIINQITDPTNLLTADKVQIQNSFDKAKNTTDIKVYCVFVPDFTNPSDPDSWIQQTAALSNFSSKSVLFAVATQSGKTAIFIPNDSEKLHKHNLDTVSPAVVQLLSNSLWSEATIEFAKEISAQADANSLPLYLIVFIIVIISGAIIGLLYLIFFRKKDSKINKPKRLKKTASI